MRVQIFLKIFQIWDLRSKTEIFHYGRGLNLKSWAWLIRGVAWTRRNVDFKYWNCEKFSSKAQAREFSKENPSQQNTSEKGRLMILNNNNG